MSPQVILGILLVCVSPCCMINIGRSKSYEDYVGTLEEKISEQQEKTYLKKAMDADKERNGEKMPVKKAEHEVGLSEDVKRLLQDIIDEEKFEDTSSGENERKALQINTENLKVSLVENGGILDLDSPNLDMDAIKPYLHGEKLARRKKVWALVSKLDDMIAEKHHKSKKNVKTLSEVDGLFDDILMDAEDVQRLINSLQRSQKEKKTAKRNMISKPASKWSMPIKYKIKNPGPNPSVVKAAINIWEQETCVSFKEVKLFPRIVFRNNKDGCWSKVGKKPISQTINLGTGCETVPITLHEIGHALGFWHEQSRHDRNNFVTINWDNIESGKEHNFVKYDQADMVTYSVPYDYASIMHYRNNAFNEDFGDKTIETTDDDYSRTIGQRSKLSFFDVKIANYHYCSGKCSGGLSWSKCKNGGYRNPNKCTECKCPDGWGGTFCVTPASNSGCGQKFLQASSFSKTLKSPGYPSPGYSSSDDCTWKITAPFGKKVHLKFVDDFEFHCSTSCKDYVEVRYKSLWKPGPRFCCGSRPTKTFVSTGNTMLINFRTSSGFSSKDGFKALYSTGEFKSWIIRPIKPISPLLG